MGVRLERRGEVFVLDLGDGDNRFDGTSVGDIEEALAEVEGTDGPRALVTTAGGKIWSNGLDLDWMSTRPGESGAFVDRVHRLFATVLASGVPSVAAVQGHAFAGGAMLALAHDRLLMREAHDLDQLLDAAVGWAAEHAHQAGPTLAAIKAQMYGPALRALGHAAG